MGVSDPTLPVFWETYIWVKMQQLELDMNYWLVQNGENSTTKLYIVTLLI